MKFLVDSALSFFVAEGLRRANEFFALLHMTVYKMQKIDKLLLGMVNLPKNTKILLIFRTFFVTLNLAFILAQLWHKNDFNLSNNSLQLKELGL
jgi:hypothetical protein